MPIRCLTSKSLPVIRNSRIAALGPLPAQRLASSSKQSTAEASQPHDNSSSSKSNQDSTSEKKPQKTQAELDEELKAKMAGLAGDGGEAGVELEDGQPVSMKRSVRNNMFRYI
ncbi:hypothetical protein K490DRAFT_68791 [Saccharata proteae CBS 121410]|uniref:Uncharacterized protein n=1 Tax=Saccharata proteae CBS 121410 TaxID=1314787 RepID=A0A9P4LU51_9PEZI|nr:hypothetical protein K490DRAFT_68791 [Saccharata proteae CBS 121410]